MAGVLAPAALPATTFKVGQTKLVRKGAHVKLGCECSSSARSDMLFTAALASIDCTCQCCVWLEMSLKATCGLEVRLQALDLTYRRWTGTLPAASVPAIASLALPPIVCEAQQSLQHFLCAACGVSAERSPPQLVSWVLVPHLHNQALQYSVCQGFQSCTRITVHQAKRAG